MGWTPASTLGDNTCKQYVTVLHTHVWKYSKSEARTHNHTFSMLTAAWRQLDVQREA
jgi:hypothetical protein